MAKLKEVLAVEKEKSKVVTGKITKVKKIPEVPPIRKVEVKLRSQQKKLENLTSVTPFSKNSTLKFTSTPLNGPNAWPNGSLSLKRIPSRVPLSPILSNTCNTKQGVGNIRQNKKERGDNVAVQRQNFQKSDVKSSKVNNENVEPYIRIGTRRQSVGVRKIRPAPNSEDSRNIVNQNNSESRCSRQRVRRKLSSSVELLSSGSQSSIQDNTTVKSYVFSDSSASPISRTGHGKSAEKLPPKSAKIHPILKRLQSDWSNTTLGEEIPNSDNSRNLVNQDNSKSRCSRQRVRRKLGSSDELLSSGLQSSIQNNTTDRSYVFSDSSASPITRTGHRESTEKLPPKPGKNHPILKRLQSCWSSSTNGKEIPTPSVVRKPIKIIESAEKNDAAQQYRQNNCSKLRARLRSSTVDSNSPSIDVNPKRRQSCHDNTLVKQIKSDWTSTTFADTSIQNRTPKNNQIQRKQGNKRLLTPLIEMSVEDTTTATRSLRANRTKTRNNEEEYSSSVEFQSDDEDCHQSRSKRAPTWKDLLNKTSESPAVKKNSVPEVQPKKSKRLNSKICTETARRPEKGMETTQKKQEHNTVGGDCQVIEVKRTSNVNKNIEPTGKENENEVSNDVSTHEIGKQNQDSVPNISVCEETIASSSQCHQNNDSLKPNSGKNTSSPRDETVENNIIDLRCPIKFFHSRLENTVSEAKSTESPKRRRSSRRKKQESIYEFLSQSSSESNNPVDDVIQKMIKTGKVVVAKHKKGTGKNTIPRKRYDRTRKKKIAKTEEVHLEPTKTLTAKSPVREKIQDDGLHFDDDFHFDDGENDVPEEEQVRDQRGFSNLARSAMIKQAGRIQKPLQRKPITDKKKLLAMAMKFVSQSTPVRLTPQPISGPEFSPMPGNKSPWRVDDDKLPNLFYLGRNSDNLPSFSSDYIPMTPTKNKSKSLSSFSSNDSNGENTAPPGTKVLTNEASMQALTNTRKALNYRSPLKAINIIEVVNLPPLALHSYGKKSNDQNTSKNNLKATVDTSTRKSTNNIFESISNHNSNNISNPNSNNSKSDISNENAENQLENTHNQNNRKSRSDVSNDNATNLFGFEEFIDDENSSTNIDIDKTILPNKDVLKERLQRLKQLRPNKPVVIPSKTKVIQPVFDNIRPRQKTIKQMLCSTMIDENQHHPGLGNHSFNETEDLSNLFKDPDPETTFDDSHPRRTYNRPFKRKRKMLSNHAIVLDSDASEDEEEAIVRPVKNYKAKPKKRQKNNHQLDKFVNDFNEMCKEVSQYELVVE